MHMFLVKQNSVRVVKLSSDETVLFSDIPFLLNKRSSDVWRWARLMGMKLYYEGFLPPQLEVRA